MGKRTDHPRACGENQVPVERVVRLRGSPPRVRGKRDSMKREDLPLGITPARAGKTYSSGNRLMMGKDHPRACGENFGNDTYEAVKAGSPPRVRGKRARLGRDRVDRGITPARAGKTPARRTRGRAGKDHPRACGENRTAAWHLECMGGSPPRVRGKLGAVAERHIYDGITPARAGKTSIPCGSGSAARDHPRACGENLNGSV